MMKRFSLLAAISAWLTSLFLSSCGGTPAQAGSDYLAGLGAPPPQAPRMMGVAEHTSYWDDDGGGGAKSTPSHLWHSKRTAGAPYAGW